MAAADGRIFISYRRQETAWPARQLYEALCERYGAGQVFKDVDNIAPGEDFVEKVSSTVASCQVLLAMLGPRWTEILDEDGNRRIDDPDDFVRLEVGTALSRGVLVVPILVDGAKLPKAADLPPDLAGFTRRQAVEISPTGFNLTRLFEALDQVLEQPASLEDADSRSPEVADVPPSPPPVATDPPPPPGDPAPTPTAVVATSGRPEPEPPHRNAAAGRAPAPVLIGVGVVAVIAVVLLVVQLLRPTDGVQATPPAPTTTPDPTQTLEPTQTSVPTQTPSDPAPPLVTAISASFTIDSGGTHLAPLVTCTTGRVLSIETTGELRAGDGLVSGPDGAPGWFDPEAPLADVPLGALIATIGPSAPVFVGNVRTLVCWTDGDLNLRVNTLNSISSGELTGTVNTHEALATEDDLVVGHVEVPATASWVRSDFECAAGHHYRVSATGIANAEGGGPESAGGPDGVRLKDGEMVPGSVAKEYPHRSLLGRIGEGSPFLLGSSATLTCPDDGPIELQTNDGVLEDNVGGFSVTFSRWPDPPGSR